VFYEEPRGYEENALSDLQGLGRICVQRHWRIWYELAAALGDGRALRHRDELAEIMTPDQMGKAQELAEKWGHKQ
jgi:hypothetical protein